MQTFLFLFSSYGFFSWIFVLGAAFMGVAFAHGLWASAEARIIQLRREQIRLQQELALRQMSSGPAETPIPLRTPASPPGHPVKLSVPVRLVSPPAAAPAPRSLQAATSPLPPQTSSRLGAKPVPRRTALRNDPKLGLIYYLAPDDPDPLERLPGITSAQVHELNVLGVYRFEQIARWDDAQIRGFTLLLGLDPAEIENRDWVRRAKVLHGEIHGSKMILAS